MKRFWLRDRVVKFRLPRCLEINRVRQHEPGRFLDSSLWNQIANPIACLIGDPFVNVLSRSIRIFFEIECFKWRAVEFFHEVTKRIAKVVAALSEEPVCDREGDRFARSAPLLR